MSTFAGNRTLRNPKVSTPARAQRRTINNGGKRPFPRTPATRRYQPVPEKYRANTEDDRHRLRLAVRGRLAEAAGERLSDRAIARELGVSQPFVSAIRQEAGIAPKYGRLERRGDCDHRVVGQPSDDGLSNATRVSYSVEAEMHRQGITSLRPTGDWDPLGAEDGPAFETDTPDEATGPQVALSRACAQMQGFSVHHRPRPREDDYRTLRSLDWDPWQK